jgi:hypothetical protein
MVSGQEGALIARFHDAIWGLMAQLQWLILKSSLPSGASKPV